MKSRMYALKSGAKLKARPSGQAKRVLAELQRVREPRLASDIDDAIAKSTGKPGTPSGPHITRQDSLRVTLYYLLVFKKAGAVVATEQPAEVDVDLDEVNVDESVDESVDEARDAAAELEGAADESGDEDEVAAE